MTSAYLVLKTASGLYGRSPAELAPAQLERVRRIARRQQEMETRVLATAEARAVVLPAARVESALQQIRSRYESEQDYRADLARTGLSEETFVQALVRELTVEAVLDHVACRIPPVSDTEVELYYRSHPAQFIRPERRLARHILVTVNPKLAENTRAAARVRMQAIAARLAKDPDRFEELALRHSECPSALDGGLLGEVARGVLYPRLDAALFALQPMQISPVVESPLGLHLLRCDRIVPARTLALDEVRERIRQFMSERRRREHLRQWLELTDRSMRQS